MYNPSFSRMFTFLVCSLSLFFSNTFAQSPGNVSTNLELWLKANAGVTTSGSDVTTWTDQATIDGSDDVSQGTTGNQPDLISNSLNFNEVIEFDGTDDWLDAGAVLAAGDDSHTFLVVWETDVQKVSSVIEQNSSSVTSGARASLYTLNAASSNYGYDGEANDANNILNYTINVPQISTLVLDGSTTVTGYHNGVSNTGTINTTTQNVGTDAFAIGRNHPSPGEYFDGAIAEVIVYSSNLSDSDRQKIESYLAIKYGITIYAGTTSNYLASDGETIWNTIGNASYGSDVTGIGRDDNSGLDQRKSANVSSSAILTIANGDVSSPTAFAADDSFLFWGHDGGATTFGSGNFTNFDGSTSDRMNRFWRALEVGTVGTVEVSFDNSLASGTVSLVVNPGSGSNQRVYEMTDTGSAYEVTLDFGDSETFTFVNASAATISYKPVLINEIIVTPRQNWSTGNFYDPAPGGSEGSDDEWVELYMVADDIDLTGWTIELNDASPVSGDLTATGAFDVSNYLSTSGGTFTSTKAGDYLILGNVNSTGAINATGTTTINLRNGSGNLIDMVVIATGSGTGFNGNSTDATDESIARVPSGADTNVNSDDYSKTRATLGTTNSPSGTVKINEVVTAPQTDWSTNGFDGTDGMSTVSAVDEYIELYIGSDGINLTGWTLQITGFSGDLTSSGAFDVSNYIGSGSFINTVTGDYLVLGNPDGSNSMGDSDLIILYDAAGTEIDRVQLGGLAGQAPSGASSNSADEAIVRYTNATDTGADDNDFIQTISSLGYSNSLSGSVLINEVVTDPQQDWSTNSFNGTVAGGTVNTEDEWVELYIGTANMNLTNWSIELTDGSNVTGNLTSTGAFDVSNYISSGSGSFLKTEVGDYLVLGNVDGADDMSDDILITLRDATGAIVDEIELGDDPASDGAGDGAPDGSANGGDATGTSDESIARIPNATDTDNDVNDFSEAEGTPGVSNALVALPGPGNGLTFDGTDDYVDLGSQIISSSAFTVEAWVNASSFTNSGRFNRILAVDYGSYTVDNPFAIFVNNSGEIGYVLGTGDALNDSQVPLAFSPTLSTSTWYHVVLTFDGSTKNLYVDGILEGSVSNTGTFTNTNSEQLLIGDFATADPDNGEWEGQIDELRIWDDVRSHEEILENMFSTLDGTEANLSAYYNFDQSSGTSLPDIAGSNDGTLQNMAGSEWSSGGWNTYSQNAAIFQSGGSDTSTGTSGELTLTDISFLNDDNDILLTGHENSTFSQVTTDLPSGTLVTARYNRNWHITKNDEVGTANGTVTFSFDLGATPSADSTYYLLERTGVSGDFFIVPVIGINPSGTSVVFTVNTSQIDNGSYYTLGLSNSGVGNALDFDGTNDFVTIADADEFSFGNGTTDSPFSIEAWAFFDVTTSSAIISKRAGFDEWHMVLSGGGQLSITLADASATAFLFGETSGLSLNTSQWYHLAFTYDGSSAASGISLYVDGVEFTNNSSSSGVYTAMENTSSAVELGTINSSSSFDLDGQIDEIRVWSDVRTQAEIVANMFTNLAGDEADLVGYYRMNQGIGNNDNNLPDLSGDNNNGTLNNFDNLNAATASSNYVTAARNVIDDVALIVNGGTLSTASDELTLTSTQTAGDYLQDAGDQIIWGNDDGAFTETAADVPSTTLVTNRITKTWNIDKNDVVGTANGNVTFSFDLGTTPNTDYTYYLLSRASTSGDFSVVEVIDSEPNGNSIEFTVDGAQITDENYFTLGRSGSGAGNAIDLDGTNDYVDLGDLGLTTGTIEMWVNTDDVVDDRRIYSQLTGLTTQAGPLGIDPGGAGNNSIYVWSGASWLELVNLTSDWSGEWHHLAVVYSGGSATAYWDGLEQMTQTTNFDFNGVSMGIGAQYTGGNGTTFNGKIDEVRVWSDARTRSEIVDNMHTNLAGTEAGLVRYYRCNEGIPAGTNTGVDLLPDRSGNGNSAAASDLALSGSSSNWVDSDAPVVDAGSSQALIGPGNALDFDGSNDYVRVPDNATLETSSLLTVEAWLRPTSVAGSQAAVSRYFTSGDASNVFLIDLTTTTLRFFINQSNNTLVSATSTIAANEWTHVAGVADGSNVHIYVNGILQASSAYDGTITSSSSRDLAIGKYRTEDNTGPFVGQIDEVRIWNVARDATQIQDNMYEELTGSETGLVAYYQFDEMAGTSTLPDESANSNTGTLTDMDAANDWVDASAREPFKTTTASNWNNTSTWKGGAIPNASTADLNITDNINLDANITINDLNINSGVTLTLNSSQTLTVTGNLINNGTITGAGAISFAGSGAQCLTAGTYSNVTLSNTADEITMDGNCTFTGTLTLTNGNLILGTNNLTISSGGSISGGSSSSYIQTLNQNSSGGVLQMEVANGAGTVTFPIGTSTYTPFSMVNLGTTGDFTLRVFDDTYVNGTSGAVITTAEEVDKTWDVTALGSGYNTTITIQWNSTSDEEASFDRANMFLSQNEADGIWNKITDTFSATSLGSNNYSASASGITSFSQVGGGSGSSLLPVTLISFEARAQNDGIALAWQTASEWDNEGFEIEHATDARNFKKIGFVSGSGTTSATQAYDFLDNSPVPGTNYYRLKQLDLNGAYEYSEVVKVVYLLESNGLSVYPNPFSDGISVEFAKAVEGSIKLNLYALTGELLVSKTFQNPAKRIQLESLGLKAGIYFLLVQKDNANAVVKLIKE